MKILFIYPNINKEKTIQIGIASLLGTIKEAGHESVLFDLTFKDNMKAGQELAGMLQDGSFGLVACSARSTEWAFSRELLQAVPEGIPVIVGGPHATVAPEEVMAEPRVDMLCRGEGEAPLKDLLEKLSNGDAPHNAPGLWVRTKTGEIKKNEIAPLQDLDELAMPLWDQFDDRHLDIDNMYGKARRVGAFELSRGCPFNCSFCINHTVQRITSGKGAYHREKSPERCIEEIVRHKDRYNLDYIYFVDETFLVNRKRLEEFCALYKQRVGLPFCFMSRAELVDDEKLGIIAGAGGHAIGIGIESGNESLRKSILNRHMPDEKIIEAFACAKSHDLKTLSFNMIGLPYETEEDILLTLELNRRVKPDIVQVTIFYPLPGTDLMDYCVENDLIDFSIYDSLINYYDFSVLKFPPEKKEKLQRWTRLLPMLVWAGEEFLPIFKWLLEDHRAYVDILNKPVRGTFLSEFFMTPTAWDEDLYRKLLLFSWEYLSQGLKQQQEKIAGLESDIAKHKEENAGLQSEAGSLRAENAGLSGELAGSKAENNALAGQVKKLELENDALSCNNRYLMNRSFARTAASKLFGPVKNIIKRYMGNTEKS